MHDYSYSRHFSVAVIEVMWTRTLAREYRGISMDTWGVGTHGKGDLVVIGGGPLSKARALVRAFSDGNHSQTTNNLVTLQ